jgi:hypothetical protein
MSIVNIYQCWLFMDTWSGTIELRRGRWSGHGPNEMIGAEYSIIIELN